MRSNIPSARLWVWWLLTFVGFPVGGGLAYLAAGSNIDILRYNVIPWKYEDG